MLINLIFYLISILSFILGRNVALLWANVTLDLLPDEGLKKPGSTFLPDHAVCFCQSRPCAQQPRCADWLQRMSSALSCCATVSLNKASVSHDGLKSLFWGVSTLIKMIYCVKDKQNTDINIYCKEQPPGIKKIEPPRKQPDTLNTHIYSKG